MKWYKLLNVFLIIAGAFVVGGWIVVDIFSSEKLNPVFAACGLIISLLGCTELNHIEIMEKLNERTRPT